MEKCGTRNILMLALLVTLLPMVARGKIKRGSQSTNICTCRPRHCKDLLDNGDTGMGLREIYPYIKGPYYCVTVFCDQTTDQGGWTVFQRRSDDGDREDFYRTWIEYRLGFGDLEGEFWMGNDLLNVMTSTTLQELRIDLEDYDGNTRHAKYGVFHVDTLENLYPPPCWKVGEGVSPFRLL